MARGWKKPLLFGCIGVPLLTCGIGGWLVYSRVSGSATKLSNEIAKLKAHGVPTEIADLAPNPPVPNSENAANLYHDLGAQLKAIKNDPSVKLLDDFYNSDNPGPDLSKVLQATRTHQAIFAVADKLISKPRVDFKRDYSNGVALLFPEYNDMRRIAKWQCSRARAQWMSGNRDAALLSLRAAYRVAEHISLEAHLIGQMVCTSITSICHRTLEYFVVDARNDPAFVQKVEKMLLALQDRADIWRAFGGELVIGRVTLQTMKTGGFSSITDTITDPSMREMGFLDALLSDPGLRRMYEAKYCEAWRTIFDGFPSDKEDWNGLRAAYKKRWQEITADKSIENAFNRLMFADFSDSADTVAKQVAERRVQLLSLKLLQTRAKGLPADLSAYGQLAIDPFTNKPMRYERKGKAFKIWSIGPDRIDQGGVSRGRGSGTKGFDIVMGFDIAIPKAQPTQ